MYPLGVRVGISYKTMRISLSKCLPGARTRKKKEIERMCPLLESDLNGFAPHDATGRDPKKFPIEMEIRPSGDFGICYNLLFCYSRARSYCAIYVHAFRRLSPTWKLWVYRRFHVGISQWIQRNFSANIYATRVAYVQHGWHRSI